MDEIIELRKKNSCPSSEAICKLIDSYISATDASMREKELRLLEDQQTIKDLSHKLFTAKNKLDMKKKVLEDKRKALKAEIEKLEELEREKNRLLKLNINLEKKCHQLKLTQPNARDQFILDLGQKKYNLYKRLTRIRWDFGALEEVTKGFVTDKKSYIHTFCYPKEIRGEELSDLLWREIELSTKKEFSDSGDKENSSTNIGNI